VAVAVVPGLKIIRVAAGLTEQQAVPAAAARLIHGNPAALARQAKEVQAEDQLGFTEIHGVKMVVMPTGKLAVAVVQVAHQITLQFLIILKEEMLELLQMKQGMVVQVSEIILQAQLSFMRVVAQAVWAQTVGALIAQLAHPVL
jgi:hypothetical protein